MSTKALLRFGALCPPLEEQVREAGYVLRRAAHHQADADAITRLAVRGILTEGDVHKARARLTTALAKDVVEEPEPKEEA
jgi:hypothetical protein